MYAYLELCAEVWEHGAALAAWRQAVARQPTSLRLWRRYLRISTRTFASFSGKPPTHISSRLRTVATVSNRSRTKSVLGAQ